MLLHERKAARSYFGGKVTGYRVVDEPKEYAGRIIFEVTSEGRHESWEGMDHDMAWSSGIID